MHGLRRVSGILPGSRRIGSVRIVKESQGGRMTAVSYPVRFGIQTPQQHGSWPDMLALWQEVDSLGFDTAWVFDHFLPIFSDPTGPCLEGWTALAALAMATKNVCVGVMVT